MVHKSADRRTPDHSSLNFVPAFRVVTNGFAACANPSAGLFAAPHAGVDLHFQLSYLGVPLTTSLAEVVS
jgi:hypothetical protein